MLLAAAIGPSTGSFQIVSDPSTERILQRLGAPTPHDHGSMSWNAYPDSYFWQKCWTEIHNGLPEHTNSLRRSHRQFQFVKLRGCSWNYGDHPQHWKSHRVSQVPTRLICSISMPGWLAVILDGKLDGNSHLPFKKLW